MIFLFCFIGKQSNELADLDDTHAAGILKKIVLFKAAFAVTITVEIIIDTVTINNYFFQN